jgi:hypothetical protein
MNKSRFETAKPKLARFFQGLPTRIHRQNDIAPYFNESRMNWRLSEDTTPLRFRKLLLQDGWLVYRFIKTFTH